MTRWSGLVTVTFDWLSEVTCFTAMAYAWFFAWNVGMTTRSSKKKAPTLKRTPRARKGATSLCRLSPGAEDGEELIIGVEKPQRVGNREEKGHGERKGDALGQVEHADPGHLPPPDVVGEVPPDAAEDVDELQEEHEKGERHEENRHELAQEHTAQQDHRRAPAMKNIVPTRSTTASGNHMEKAGESDMRTPNVCPAISIPQ